jgi:hypothetical protein
MEYRLSPTGRIESRRKREMVKKQVRTMATAEKIASGGDWYISLWTADAKVWVQKNGGVNSPDLMNLVYRRCENYEKYVTGKSKWRQGCSSGTNQKFGQKQRSCWQAVSAQRLSGLVSHTQFTNLQILYQRACSTSNILKTFVRKFRMSGTAQCRLALTECGLTWCGSDQVICSEESQVCSHAMPSMKAPSWRTLVP